MDYVLEVSQSLSRTDEVIWIISIIPWSGECLYAVVELGEQWLEMLIGLVYA